MTITEFEELEIWKDARELCKVIRKYSSREYFRQDFGLKNQINNASGSIMDNIAEGFERDGNREFLQFLSVSKASCGEVRSQSYRAFDAGFIDATELKDLLSRTEILRKKIIGFMFYLKRTDISGRKFKPVNSETNNPDKTKSCNPETPKPKNI